MRRGNWAGLALFCMLGLVAGAARADDAPAQPPPDKSGFTFLNPTPDADLRSFCTDRPTKSTGPCTVDAGHLQLESDVFNLTYDAGGGQDVTTLLYTNPTLKLGLTNTIDIEANIAPWESIWTRDHGKTTRDDGVGDLYLRLKANFLGDDGGNLAIAIAPYVKVPTAPAGVGNGAVEAGLIVPIQVNLPAGWSLTIDPEADALKDAVDGGLHPNLAGLLSFSHALNAQVTLSLELWSDIDFDPSGETTQASFDIGAAWIPKTHPNFQLDGGVNIGLDRETPAAQAYMGVSRRF